PPRDKTYLAWIREMPCIACGVEGRSVAAHTGTDGGMSQKASDYSCVPLCADCHTQAPGAYHRAGRGTFERRHGLSFAGAVARLNREWQARCAGFGRCLQGSGAVSCLNTERLFNRDVANDFTDVASAARGASLPEQRPRPCGPSGPAQRTIGSTCSPSMIS